ncbi:MAG: GOLPH3/VPS74 family protein [Chthoniobacterales bacterium]|jgi:Golgi phosphoprotein 3
MSPLTFTEEIVLLALDDRTGAPLPLPVTALAYGLGGAVLADLAVAGKIDTDEKKLIVLDTAPTGDALLDPWLALIAAETTPHPVAHWLSVLADRQQEIEQPALDRLIARGILRREDKKILWVIGLRRYPTVDGHERAEVRTRLGELILGDDIPDPRDAILISLLSGCRLTDKIFSGPEYTARGKRLETLAKTDLVGREVAAATTEAIDALTGAMNTAVPHM